MIELMLKQNGAATLVVVLVVLLILAGVYFFSAQKNDTSSVTSPQAATTPSPVTTTDPTAGWKVFSNNIYSIKYPEDWTVKESQDPNFGDQVTISNPQANVFLRVMSGRQEFHFGAASSTKINNLTVRIEGVDYPLKEVILNNHSAYVDQRIKKGEKEYQILFGTGYPVAEDVDSSLSDYNKDKETIIKILSTLNIKNNMP